MLFRKTWLVAAIAAVLVSCAPAPKAPDTTAMVSAAEALDKAFEDAFNKQDAKAIAALYWSSPDVVSFPPDTMELRGPAAIERANAEFFTAMPGAKMQLYNVFYTPVGDKIFTSGKWRVTIPNPAGGSETMEGRYTDLKGQVDGKWVYLMDHASIPSPPPAGN